MKRRELKILRVKHDLTQQQLADELGINVGTYNLIENGKSNGSRKIWLKLQELFNLGDAEVWKLQNPQI